MISASSDFKDQLELNNHDYQVKVSITLADDTVLTDLTNERLFECSIEEGVSGDTKFEALGSAVIAQATITINNYDGFYSGLDFKNAVVIPYVGLTIGTSIEYVKKGEFIVDTATPKRNGIELICFDYMSKFDRAYSESTLTYPATVDDIIDDACTVCGVTLSGTIPHDDLVLYNTPSSTVSFRAIIAAIAELVGCFARVNKDGELYFGWFQDFEDAEDEDIVIIDDYSLLIPDQSDTEITGVRAYIEVVEETQDPETGEIEKEYKMEEYLVGTSDFCIDISENMFLMDSNAPTIVSWLADELVGLTFRKLTSSHINNPLIEAGDIGQIRYKTTPDTYYNFLVTRTIFSVGKLQNTVCAAESKLENQSAQYKSSDIYKLETRKELERYDENLDQREVFNKLTNDGDAQGIYLADDGQLYINLSYLRSGILESGIIRSANGDSYWDLDNGDLHILGSDIVVQEGDPIYELQEDLDDYKLLKALYLDFSSDPSEGLTIGGKTSGGESIFKTRITNTQMSFLQNGEIIAYINGLKYHIRRGEIEQALTVGTFEWRIEDDGDSLNLVLL